MSTQVKKKQRNSQVMDLKQLISAPLIATLQADAMTTQGYVDFLREVAFEADEKGGLGKLRTFTFQYNQNDKNGKTSKKVEIPVISLIPIPLLQIKEATFDFDIKILDSITEYSEQEFSFNGENEKQEEGKTAIRAALAPQQGKSSDTKDSSLTANMKVQVVMQQADMPAGLANLLSLSAHNMSVEDAEEAPGESPRPAIT